MQTAQIEWPELTHDLIADAIGEVLTHGTTDFCLDKVLSAAITHISRRVCANLDMDETETAERVKGDFD